MNCERRDNNTSGTDTIFDNDEDGECAGDGDGNYDNNDGSDGNNDNDIWMKAMNE